MEHSKRVTITLLRDEEIEQVVSFYNSIYHSSRDREKFIWEFQKAPAGKAIYVVAKDEDNGKIVGTQCAIPMYVRLTDGTMVLTAKSEDTLVDPGYRGMSIFDRMYELLFEECSKAGFKAIWGFTSAQKPFLKLGFEIPFAHTQCLRVYHLLGAFKYLTSLNVSNNTRSRIKIFGLSVLSCIRTMTKRPSSEGSFYKTLRAKQAEMTDLEALTKLFSASYDQGFAIALTTDFLRWRVKQNPYYKNMFWTVILQNDRPVGTLLLNERVPGVWYLVYDNYSSDMTSKQKAIVFNKAISEFRKEKRGMISLIRGWNFDHNHYGKQEIQLRNDCGFMYLKRGISFVWKSLDKSKELNPKDFILSRLAAQGVF